MILEYLSQATSGRFRKLEDTRLLLLLLIFFSLFRRPRLELHSKELTGNVRGVEQNSFLGLVNYIIIINIT